MQATTRPDSGPRDPSTDEQSEPAWQDPETLRTLYLEEDLTRAEVAERLGCSKGAIDDQLTAHGIRKTGSQPWHDADRLRTLYHDEDMTLQAIADHFDTSRPTIHHWMQRHDIETDAATGQTYDDAELLEHLQAVNDDVEYRVTKADVDERDGPASSTLSTRFGSWIEALKAADIDPDAPTREPSDARETLVGRQGAILSRSPGPAHDLVEIDDPFLFSDLDWDRGTFSRLREAGIITRASEERVDNAHEGSCGVCWEWQVADGVRGWIEANVDVTGECPNPDCRSSGVRNLGDGAFTCTNPECDVEFDEATAREVLR
jgi:predicted DNA-binding protein YlxM (UPF0122 family)